jgi:hypothetical protein
MYPVFTIMGKYQREALERERDRLWRSRFLLGPGQAARLDELIDMFGSPEPVTFPKIDASALGAKHPFESFDYTERS